jgi:hypothetical protein
MNKFENGLLNPEPKPVECYLQEEDPPAEHDIERYSAVCGRCYGALAGLLRSAEDELAAAREIISLYVEFHESDHEDRRQAEAIQKKYDTALSKAKEFLR